MLAAILLLAVLPEEKPVKFTKWDDYHAKNTEQESPLECLALTTRAAFDDRFDVLYFGFGESKAPTQLPKDAFDTHMAVAVIRRGHSVYRYEVESLTADGEALTLRFRSKAGQEDSATYASPLVVTLPKGPYKSVTFVENGKEVGKARFGEKIRIGESPPKDAKP